MNSNNFLLGVSSVKKNNKKNHLNEEKTTFSNIMESSRTTLNNINIEKNNKPTENKSLESISQLSLNKYNKNIRSSNTSNSNESESRQPLTEPSEINPKYSDTLINHIKNIENDIKNNHGIIPSYNAPDYNGSTSRQALMRPTVGVFHKLPNLLSNNIKMKNVVSKIISKLEGNINSLTNKINKFNNEKRELYDISKKEQENFKDIIRKMYILIITIYKSLIVNKDEKIILLEKLRSTIESNTQFLYNIDKIVKENNKELIANNNLAKENNITISNILQRKNINITVEKKNKNIENNNDVFRNLPQPLVNQSEIMPNRPILNKSEEVFIKTIGNNKENKNLNKNYLNLLEENKKNIQVPTSSVIREEKKQYEKVANKIKDTKINEATAKNKLNKYISYLQ
jgi:hypothetical protein